jgi:hypothetical protein
MACLITGSGRKVPGTARLRTGIQPAGPGTQVTLLYTPMILESLLILPIGCTRFRFIC